MSRFRISFRVRKKVSVKVIQSSLSRPNLHSGQYRVCKSRMLFLTVNISLRIRTRSENHLRALLKICTLSSNDALKGAAP